MGASSFTPRVLVVENDQGLCDLLAALLTEEGYEVICASSLPQALALSQDQVFNGIFTTLFPQSQENPLLSTEPLRLQTLPTPIIILCRSFVSEAEARWRGYATVLESPFRIEDVLQVLARYIDRPFRPEQARQANLITSYLDAMGQEQWERVRQLCLPTVRYIPLTDAPMLEGIEAYLAYAQAARAQLPGYRQEHRVVFEQQGHLVTHFSTSWQGRDGQRLAMTGSVVCRFAGERIVQIGVALNRQRLGAHLANTAAGADGHP